MSDPNDYATPPPPPPAGTSTPGERNWALFAHLSGMLGVLVTGWVGCWGAFIGPLIIWLVKRDDSAFIDDQAKEALNFNITISLAYVLLWIFTLATFFIGGLLTIPLMIVIGIAALVLSVVAAVKASEGVAYRYPFALRLVK